MDKMGVIDFLLKLRLPLFAPLSTFFPSRLTV